MDLAATHTSKLPQLIQQQRNTLTEIPKTKEDSVQLNDHAFFGCSHYLRKCKICCPECQRFYPCRVCHDKICNHDIDRSKIELVFCYACESIVKIDSKCSECKEVFGRYYCPSCHLINDDPLTQLYHCDKCGICRQGKKENSYHCDSCQACYVDSAKYTHPCRADSAKDNCPVCRESIFSSRKGVWAGPCGHYMHNKCVLSLYKFSHFRCPLCQEPLIDTSHPPKELEGEE